MKVARTLALIAFAFVLSASTHAHSIANLADQAVSSDAANASQAIRQLRLLGPDAEFDKMLSRLRGFVGLDTTRNDFAHHMQLYSWLNEAQATDLETFNSRVYAAIFKTPDSDKWLGLYSTDVYAALDGNRITM